MAAGGAETAGTVDVVAMADTAAADQAMETVEADVLVVGAGAAGLTAALGCASADPSASSREPRPPASPAPSGPSAPSADEGTRAAPRSPRRRVLVLTKTRSSGAGAGGASVWAQGGVASAVGDDDDPALHAADTLAAGAGLNDAAIVSLLTGDGPRRVRSLLALGARFDRDPGGRLALGKEAAHSRRRILHAHGDATGAEVVRTLVDAVHREPSIGVVDETFALDLVREAGAVVGLRALHRNGRRVLYRAPAVVLATGGLGQLFLHTTNPREATADGLAMAARAGARLVDLEFVQFHPTALAVHATEAAGTPGAGAAAGAPLPLLTEALRGEGAVLIDDRGVRFMAAVHPDRELAPRDVVARAIWARLAEGRRVFLDATRAVGERFPERFPTVFALCRQHGLDPRVEPLPVVPAAHYHMGGVAVDARGRTSLPGLWACGEVAATGAHGANRLASNSLLEALVFGARVAEDIQGLLGVRDGDGVERAAAAARSRPLRALVASVTPVATMASVAPVVPAVPPDLELAAAGSEGLVARLRRVMWERVGVERDEAGLAAAVAELAALSRQPATDPAVTTAGTHQPRASAPADPGFAAAEARNLLLAGRLLAQAARERRESRGGHYRVDHPHADAAWQRRLFLTVTAAGTARFEAVAVAAPGHGAADVRRPEPMPAAVARLA
jgi:L-aspartate oxidase